MRPLRIYIFNSVKFYLFFDFFSRLKAEGIDIFLKKFILSLTVIRQKRNDFDERNRCKCKSQFNWLCALLFCRLCCRRSNRGYFIGLYGLEAHGTGNPMFYRRIDSWRGDWVDCYPRRRLDFLAFVILLQRPFFLSTDFCLESKVLCLG